MDRPLGFYGSRSATGDVVVGFCDNQAGDKEGEGGDVGVQVQMDRLVLD